jgi:phosphate transport system substrate-binding protein
VSLVAVDSGGGCITPSNETVSDGSYTPLSRPLFVYVNKVNYAENAALPSFVQFLVANSGEAAVTAGYIGLTADQTARAEEQLASI